MDIEKKYYSIEQLTNELNTNISRVWYLVRKEKIKPVRRLDLLTQDCFKSYNSKTRLLFSNTQLEQLRIAHDKSRRWKNE